MLKRLVLFTISVTLCIAGLFADQADLVFAALKAKNDKEVTRLLQDLALARDYPQLDKIQEKNPELFEAKYFSGDFVSKILFNYVENAAAKAKAAQKATGTTNPHAKSSSLWYIWDLDKALAARAATKDAALQKNLTAQVTTDMTALQKKLESEYMDTDERFVVSLYLYALSMGATPGDQADAAAAEAERLNARFAEEANGILEYLFKAGVPFPATLPVALKLDAWKRLISGYNTYLAITKPNEQNEYETKAEYVARQEESKRLYNLIYSTEITLPAQLALGDYNVEGGYFSLSISLPALTIYNQSDLTRTTLANIKDLEKADIRYYINRKNAPFFKEKGFASWTALATITVRTPKEYGLKEIIIKNGKELQTEGLWAFRIWVAVGSAGESLIKIENYIKGNEYDFSGTKVSGLGKTIPITADGNYTLVSSTSGPGQLWGADLTAVWVPVVGGPGPAGGIIFYKKGDSSGGWHYLEAAPSDQSAGIEWYNGKNINIRTDTALGTGMANTAAIIAVQGVGSYAATLCDSLVLGDYDDWFLPSKDELNLMYTNLKKAGLGGFGDIWFWSSSQDYYNNEYYAWRQDFSDSGQGSSYKNYKYAVRAVRQGIGPGAVVLEPATITAPVSVPATVSETSSVSSKTPVVAPVQPAATVAAKAAAVIPKGFVLVEAGNFLMGSPNTEKGREKHEGPQHQVTLSSYLIGQHEVTVAEFDEFISSSGYRTTAEKEGSGVDRKNAARMTPNASWQNPFIPQTSSHPVVMVSWMDVMEYCNWRSVKEGLEPAFIVKGSNISINLAANGYRMPTEAEWEYAARGGSQWALQPFIYAGSANLEEVGWYGKNSGGSITGSTKPVGKKKPNVLGLFDMSGNAAEWCWDVYAKDYYANSPAKDPLGPETGSSPVYRGGSWIWDTPNFERVSYRGYAPNPLLRTNDIGFRLVRKP